MIHLFISQAKQNNSFNFCLRSDQQKYYFATTNILKLNPVYATLFHRDSFIDTFRHLMKHGLYWKTKKEM